MTNAKKIVFVHGDKGGVGKSMVASIIVDYYLANYDANQIMLIEGDGTVPDVARRFGGLLSCVNAPLTGDDPTEMIAKLIDLIESSDVNRIIVNLPASAGETIDPLAADFIAPALEEIGVEIATVFVMGKTKDSLILAERSLTSGLASISNYNLAVLNGFFGNPESFSWSQNDEVRSKWYESGAEEIFLPMLHERVANVATEGAFTALAEVDGGLTVANRMLLKRWLKEAHSVGAKVEGGEGGDLDGK